MILSNHFMSLTPSRMSSRSLRKPRRPRKCLLARWPVIVRQVILPVVQLLLAQQSYMQFTWLLAEPRRSGLDQSSITASP